MATAAERFAEMRRSSVQVGSGTIINPTTSTTSAASAMSAPANPTRRTRRASGRAPVDSDVAAAPLRRTGFALTDLGRKRASNEDAFFIDDELGLYVVADGMGGHAAGEIASREAIDTLYGMVKRGLGQLRV